MSCSEVSNPSSPKASSARIRITTPATIVAGVVILIRALEAFGLDGFETSEHDILRGVALWRASRGR